MIAARLLGMFSLAGMLLAACSTNSPTPPQQRIPLANTFDSADALAAAVLDALARSDRTTLQALPLSEQEFRDHVWPELPTSRPERNVPFDYAWGQLKQQSDGSFAQMFARNAGKRYRLVRVAFTGDTTTYQTFSVRRASEIVAADETGRESVLTLFGSVMVTNGRFKMFSYVVDD